MKKLIGIAVIIIILAALFCSFGISNAVVVPPYAPTDRPYVEFQDSFGTPIQSDTGGFFEFICTSPLPATVTYKAKVHIPATYTTPLCRLKLSVDWLPINASSPDVTFSFPSSTGGLISDGDVFTFTISTASWGIPANCWPTNTSGVLMVHVGAAFYLCNATKTGYIGTTSPAIQGLDINKKCCTTTTTVQPTTIPTTVPPTTVPPTTVPPTTTVPQTLIELQSFTAKPCNKAVILKWQTESEIDNVGFNILRAESEDGEYIKINDALIPAEGSAANGASYKFTDSGLNNRQTYYYMLEDLDANGTATKHGTVEATPRLWSQCGKYNK